MRDSEAMSPVVAGATADSAAVLNAFFEMAQRWQLSTEEQIVLLGQPARSTFFKWKKGGATLSTDTEERLSHLFSIWKALQILVPDPDLSDSWIRRENRFFGMSPLDRMLRGQVVDIYAVREYLDAERGG
ncbi:MAG: MbcA/ParS/Xre antitoxin family protein [Hyphomonas sp.]